MGLIYADLHTHSTFSDGTYSPEGLVSLAKLRGLSIVALTDHDTTEGISRALEAGKYYGIEVVPGVELSCEFEAMEVHVLGYFINPDSEDLQSILFKQRLRRRERMDEMVHRLNSAGVKLSLDRVLSYAQGGVVGRPHLAQVLLDMGYVRDLKDAYSRFIGRQSPYYVPTYRLDIGQAIEAIVSAGGVPVLAHPVFIASKYVVEIIKRFRFWGIEVFYPEHSPRYVSSLLSLVEEYGLVPTGGSDFHGSARKEDFLGRVGLSKEQAKRFLEYYVEVQ